MAATQKDFRSALEFVLAQAESLGFDYVGVRARTLHQRVGGYPGPDHRMPVCCAVMRAMMAPQDRIIEQPPKGDGASLLIHYMLPRVNKNAWQRVAAGRRE